MSILRFFRRCAVAGTLAAALPAHGQEPLQPYARIMGFTVCDSLGQGARMLVIIQSSPMPRTDVEVLQRALDGQGPRIRNLLAGMHEHPRDPAAQRRYAAALEDLFAALTQDVINSTGRDLNLSITPQRRPDPSIPCGRPA